jgi:hypothetical protein
LSGVIPNPAKVLDIRISWRGGTPLQTSPLFQAINRIWYQPSAVSSAQTSDRHRYPDFWLNLYECSKTLASDTMRQLYPAPLVNKITKSRDVGTLSISTKGGEVPRQMVGVMSGLEQSSGVRIQKCWGISKPSRSSLLAQPYQTAAGR